MFSSRITLYLFLYCRQGLINVYTKNYILRTCGYYCLFFVSMPESNERKNNSFFFLIYNKSKCKFKYFWTKLIPKTRIVYQHRQKSLTKAVVIHTNLCQLILPAKFSVGSPCFSARLPPKSPPQPTRNPPVYSLIPPKDPLSPPVGMYYKLRPFTTVPPFESEIPFPFQKVFK